MRTGNSRIQGNPIWASIPEVRSLKTGNPGIRGNITWARAHLEHQKTLCISNAPHKRSTGLISNHVFVTDTKQTPTTKPGRHPKNMDFENISQGRYNSPTDKNTSRTRKTSTTKCRGGWGEALYNTTPATPKAHIWQHISCRS